MAPNDEKNELNFLDPKKYEKWCFWVAQVFRHPLSSRFWHFEGTFPFIWILKIHSPLSTRSTPRDKIIHNRKGTFGSRGKKLWGLERNHFWFSPPFLIWTSQPLKFTPIYTMRQWYTNKWLFIGTDIWKGIQLRFENAICFVAGKEY